MKKSGKEAPARTGKTKAKTPGAPGGSSSVSSPAPAGRKPRKGRGVSQRVRQADASNQGGAKRPPPPAPVAPRSSVRPGEAPRGQASLAALKAVEAALDKKGLEPVLFDVRDVASYTDYILIISGRSDRQVRAITDGVKQALAELGAKPLSTEQASEGQWTLIDFGDVVVHVFDHPLREFYDIEALWFDAPRVPLELPPDSRIQASESY